MGEVGEVHALESTAAAMSRSALVEDRKHFLARAFGAFIALLGLATVSYTHLTLPTIYSV